MLKHTFAKRSLDKDVVAGVACLVEDFGFDWLKFPCIRGIRPPLLPNSWPKRWAGCSPGMGVAAGIRDASPVGLADNNAGVQQQPNKVACTMLNYTV